MTAPVALNGPILTIRRFPDTPITMEKLISLGQRHQRMRGVPGRPGAGQIFDPDRRRDRQREDHISGSTVEYIPSDERVITIEDNAELKLQGIENLVRLEAKMANSEGAVSVSIRDLIRTALRMRPDRIIVGEVRGGEAVDMLQALNTGQ